MTAAAAVVVRRAEPADREQLLVLVQAFATSFTVDESRFDRTFAAALAHHDSALLVAAVRGVLVGYVLVSVHPTLYANGPVAWIEELMVHPDDRRGGVGQRLVQFAEQWAALAGAVLVALATRRAEAFWHAVGYESSATYLRKVVVRDG